VSGRLARFALALLGGVGVWGAGCTSAPVRYYTLTPPPDATLPASPTTLAVDVRVVHTPPQLNRAELMVRSGPTEVTLLENEQWASPVKDEIRNALRIELRRRLHRTSGLPPAVTKLTLDIDVQQLEAQLGQYVLLQASWTATLSATGTRSADPRSTGTRPTACAFQADAKIAGGYAGMVAGYQREIAALADSIVAVLTSPASDCSKDH
jgi:uncharacterized lipoprotein YmbA